jgi:outer membrane protein assembly factor BamB
VGTGFSSPVVRDGRLFVSGNQNDRDTIFCLDVASGATVWKYTYASEVWPYLYDGGPNATATIDGDRVFALGRHGDLFCLSAADGSVVWKADIHKDLGMAKPSWGFTSAPLVQGEHLFLNAGTHGLALEKATGKVVWQTGKGDGGYATPEPVQLGNEKALVIFGPASCSAVRAADGTALWETPWETKYKVNAAQPIIQGNQMFLSSAYGFGCALFNIDASGAKEVWRNAAMENHFNTCVLLDGHLYGVSGTSEDKCVLKCLSWKTGETLWEEKGVGMGSLIASKGQLIVLSDRGELIFAPASPKGFKADYRTQILGGKCWTPPAISGGHLYARNSKGDIVAVKLP